MRNGILVVILMTGWVAGVAAPARDALPEVKPGSEVIRSAVVAGPAGDATPAAKPGAEAEEKGLEAVAAPVPVPPLSHYAALWEKSMFTTRDLPAPEVPEGPGFADQLVLAGIYEVDGAVVAVILDKMTAQISEARIGSENELGIRIKAVNVGELEGATRIQLQKGMQSGWVAFAEATAAPTPAAGTGGGAGGGVPGQPGVRPLMSPEQAPGMGAGPGAAGGPVLVPVPGNAPPASLNPGIPAATPNPSLDDIPLPPP